MWKRSWILLLALLTLALCACGGTAKGSAAPAESGETAPAETPAETEEPGGALALPDAGLHQAEETPEEDPEIAARRQQALELIGEDADKLIDALGEPLERNYAPSCLGDGEDGELVYEGFTVYTYREGTRETVKDVA